MSATFTAQMSPRKGLWRLYVVLLNTTDSWPEHDFGHGTSVPTLADRAAALQRLGYEPTTGEKWDWTEASDAPGDPASPVTLIAATRVRLLEGDA
ncbi:DUF6303 family protein [Streptomyces sp. NPDC057596]|uniref:DUF6303 family protein n=1 Tax=Streptomyces sp. NPDC057596 TaxID=3346178 RepID=UPI00368EA85D